MEYSKEGAEMIKEHNINAGLHLNLTEGQPLYESNKRNSLLI